MKKSNEKSVEERLNKVGVFVNRDKSKPYYPHIKMMVDKDGNELGYFTPLEALQKFVHSKTFKARVKKTFPQLAHCLQEGDIIEITSKTSVEDVRYSYGGHVPNFIPKGNFTGFTFVGRDGKTYSDKTITAGIGYKKTTEVFEKLEE